MLEHTPAQPPSTAALRMSQIRDKLKLTKGAKLHWDNKTALILVATLIPLSVSFNWNNFKCIKLY